jgi:GTPase
MKKTKKYPKVVLVGRTNVGKSAIFNRLSTKTKSIVFERSGVTRDYIHEVIDWDNNSFDLIDTGGYSFKKDIKDPFAKLINEKIETLIKDASLLLFICDAKNGLTLEDQRIAKILHKTNKPVFLVLNKIDNTKAYEENAPEFYALGFDDFVPISAIHGIGIVDLLEKIEEKTKGTEIEEQEEVDYKVVIIGKPNVGKSSLMNLLIKKERSIISQIPGTTREPIAEYLKFLTSSIEIVDTAGVRRKRSIDDKLETLMVKTSFSALRDSDIAILVVDASEKKLSHQELRLLSYASENKKCLLIVFNKTDLLDDLAKEELKFNLSRYDFLLDKFPQVSISCKDKKRIARVFKALQKIWELCSQRFNSEELSQIVKESFEKAPMYKSNAKLKLLGIRQLKEKSPTFLLYVNNVSLFEDSQLSFVENILRKNFDLKGCPVKFVVKKA